MGVGYRWGLDEETVCRLSIEWAYSGNLERRAIAQHAGTPPTQNKPAASLQLIVRDKITDSLQNNVTT
jgi:hypothetical protein